MNTTQLPYIDGFVLPIPKSNLETYQKMAATAATVWKEHGALDYKECVLDDACIEGTRSFPDLAGAREDETVVFAYIVYPSREVRDEINAKVMADPRIREACPANNPDAAMPFDCSKMAYGGFQTIVSA
ncbi:MAG TPA: DUF1428 domain-containing protein [Chthoniobacteraceae bacterium]|nr:DUF1428 domain-containing protein [Chthoniobacteraceae bacterium]